MNEFHECLFNLELADIPFLSPIFTWMNRREGVNFIARKLDRCLQNEYCMDMFPNALTEVQPPGLSDHCSLVTSLNASPTPERRKNIPFKFFNFWANHPAFLGIVKEAWDRGVHGTPMYRLSQKLKRVKASLKMFTSHSFGKLRDRVEDAREALKMAQSAVLSNPSDTMLMDNERKCLKIYHDLASAEEGFLKQKSRVQWLKLDDQNTSFLQKSVKVRNARSIIKVITSGNGCRIDDPLAIKEEAVDYFKNILCVDGTSNDQEYLNNVDGFGCTPQHLDILNCEIFHEEIKKAFFFFWIIKNLLQKKGRAQTNNGEPYTKPKGYQRKPKTNSTSPKNIGKGHQPETESPNDPHLTRNNIPLKQPTPHTGQSSTYQRIDHQ